MGTLWIPLQFLLLIAVLFTGAAAVSPTDASTLYRGKYIGSLTARAHKVSGEVYAVDSKTLHIRNFVYSGTGPDAFFWVGFTEHPSPQGIIVPNEKGTKDVLGPYNMEDITLTLPGGLTLRDIKWFGVWCRAYEVNFGDLYIPADLDFPQPHVIGSLSGQHGVSSGPIVIIDSSTILVPDFSYDGQGPSVHFWVGKGKPGPDGYKLADETGSEAPLKKSDKKTMVLSLPPGLTIFDIDYLSLWCELYFVDFGHVKIPRNLNVPPSLRMLGVTPQTKLNCEVLMDDKALEVRWAIAGESIVMQLVGRIDEGQYISFGLSGDESRSVMIGGDVVVAWIDKSTGKGNVIDYYLDSKSQCSGRRGTCPDSRLQAETNNVRLLSATVVNGFTFLTFQRPLKAHDELDRTILTNASQSVIWAVGPINQRNEASYHSQRNRDDLFIDFGRVPKWNCPAPEPDEPKSSTQPPNQTPLEQVKDKKPGVFVQLTSEPRPVAMGIPTPSLNSKITTTKEQSTSGWKIPPINCFEPSDGVFYAQIGPTGGKRGYSSITGHVGWGIAWYINGLLVPEVYLVRGKTYTFVVEGGDNPEIPAKFHPFYITDDPEGGYQHKSDADRRKVKVFAGVGIDSSGKTYPTGTGRSCQWQETNGQPADSFVSYGAYQRSLTLQCDAGGHPGIVHWKPDENTPDLVYYHCFTHRYLGWKIHIVDRCDGEDSSESPSQQILQGRDQEVGESIVDERGVPKLPIGVKNEESEPSDSLEPTSLLNDSISKSKLTEKETLSDKSQLNEKQESMQTYIQVPQTGQTFVHKQETYIRPPQTILIPQSGFVQVPPAEGSSQQLPPGLYTHSTFSNVQYPYEGQLIRKEGSQQGYPFGDNYGQRVGDGYYVGPTRSPVVAHPIVSRPSIVYATTIPPQLINNARLQNRIQEAPIPPVPVGLIRDVRIRPQSRNLPKREQLGELDQDSQMFLSNEELQMGLKSLNIKDSSNLEIIKINDTDSLPFQLPPELLMSHQKLIPSRTTHFMDSKQSVVHQTKTQSDSNRRQSPPVQLFFADNENGNHSTETILHQAPSPRLSNSVHHQHPQHSQTSPGNTNIPQGARGSYQSQQIPFNPLKEMNQEGVTGLANDRPPHRPSTHRQSQLSPISHQNIPLAPSSTQRRSNPPHRQEYQAAPSEQQYMSYGLKPLSPKKASKLEIIPNDDVTMVYVKGTDDKGLQRELPKILHQLEKEAELEPEALQRRRAEVSEETQQQRSHEYQVAQAKQKGQNNTDLHILTDIWSIINNQDGSPVGKPSQARIGSPHSQSRPMTNLHHPTTPYRYHQEIPNRNSKSISGSGKVTPLKVNEENV